MKMLSIPWVTIKTQSHHFLLLPLKYSTVITVSIRSSMNRTEGLNFQTVAFSCLRFFKNLAVSLVAGRDHSARRCFFLRVLS